MTEDIHIRPINDLVLCRVLELNARVTSGGIHIPDTARSRPNQAVVVAVGPGRWVKGARVPPLVKQGDRVVFHAYKVERVLAEGAMADAPGTPIAKPGQLFLIREEHVLARVESEPPTFTEVECALDVLRAASAQFDGLTHESFGVAMEAIRDAFAKAYGQAG